jgi:hypothetical protein
MNLKPIQAPKKLDQLPEKRKKAIRRLLILFANTLLLATLYYVLPGVGFFYMPHVYLILGGALGLWYVIYNRGFNTRGMTADMLPDDLPLAKREEMIAEGNRRALRSQWALYVLLPLLLVLLFDVIYLFLIPEGLFS